METGHFLLHQVVIVAETVGSTGVSTLSLAQIIGVSERNNRRDQVTSALMFFDGRCLQCIEGRRADVDRVIHRMAEDRRLRHLRVVVDRPISERRCLEPLALCDNPRAMIDAVGLASLAAITADKVEQMIELKQAA